MAYYCNLLSLVKHSFLAYCDADWVSDKQILMIAGHI